MSKQTESEELPDLAAEVVGEITNAVAHELTKAVAVIHGVDPLTAATLGGATGGM